jgi:hypothetical protein
MIPFDAGRQVLGFERVGSTLSVAVDPRDSSRLYVGWGDRSGEDLYTLHVRRSIDRGVTWSAQDLHTLHNATNLALAVSANGVVGLLYQQLTNGRWVTHLEQTPDTFVSIRDTVLADTPADAPPWSFFPYLGDYVHLMAVGSEFRGVFSANNRPVGADFPNGVVFHRAQRNGALEDGNGNPTPISIDPFYFGVPVMSLP